MSVFGLVGYQLFHGTLRQKCIRVGGTLDLPPDSLYMYASSISEQMATVPSSSQKSHHTPQFLHLFPIRNASDCSSNKTPSASDRWKAADRLLLSDIIYRTKDLFSLKSNVSYTDENRTCFRKLQFDVTVASNLLFSNLSELNSSLGKAFVAVDTIEPIGLESNNNVEIDVMYANQNSSYDSQEIVLEALDLNCEMNNISIDSDTNWKQLVEFGQRDVTRWTTREYVLTIGIAKALVRYVYYSEMDWDTMRKQDLFDEWVEQQQCTSEPNTGLFFYPGSPERPPSEPIYCTAPGRWVRYVAVGLSRTKFF